MANLRASLKDLGVIGRNMDLIVDPAVGLVREVQEVRTEPGAPAFFHYAALACNTQAFCSQRNFANTGGAAITRDVAVAKAVGEAIERYCAAIYEREDFPLTSSAKAEFRCIPPSQFALHTTQQYAEPGFPWRPFAEDTAVRWVPAKNLATGETVYAPAAFVVIPYAYVRGSGDTPIGQPISTGLACHESPERAIVGGLAEVIERDCFTLTWQAQVSPPQIRVETLDDVGYEMVRRFEETGDHVRLLDLTSDNGIPCVLAVLVSDAVERPAHVFAAAADLDPEVAARKALEELAHTRRYSQQIRQKMPEIEEDPNWSGVVNQRDHLNVAANPSYAERYQFLFANEKRHAVEELPSLASGRPDRDLEIYVERIATSGYSAYAADLTSEDVRSLGLSVQRSLVPGYHPLFMGHRLRALAGDRLYTVPQKLGHRGIERGGPDNPFPHPYP